MKVPKGYTQCPYCNVLNCNKTPKKHLIFVILYRSLQRREGACWNCEGVIIQTRGRKAELKYKYVV